MQTLVQDTPSSQSIGFEDSVDPIEHADGTTVNSKTKPVKEQEPDERRQLGDRTVYRYYFGSIGYAFLGTLIILEIVWAFLESFPSSLKSYPIHQASRKNTDKP